MEENNKIILLGCEKGHDRVSRGIYKNIYLVPSHGFDYISKGGRFVTEVKENFDKEGPWYSYGVIEEHGKVGFNDLVTAMFNPSIVEKNVLDELIYRKYARYPNSGNDFKTNLLQKIYNLKYHKLDANDAIKLDYELDDDNHYCYLNHKNIENLIDLEDLKNLFKEYNIANPLNYDFVFGERPKRSWM